MLGLELGHEHVGLASGLVHVDWALVNALLFLALDEEHRLAVDDRYDRELLLGLGLLEAARSVPSGALDLETEDVSTISVLLLGELASLPVHLLLHLGLDVELVELDSISPSSDLLDSGQEGLRVVEPVDEGDIWLLGGVLLPGVELLEALLDVVEPRAERSGRLERVLHPSRRHFVDEDVLHKGLHLLGHGQLTLVGELDFGKRADHLLDEDTDLLALLQEHILVGAAVFFS